METTRRTFLTHGSMAGFTAFLGGQLSRADVVTQRPARFQRCVVLWMDGGPSQFDTFDPKSKLADGRNSIPTNLPGLRFGEALPRLAERADQLCLLNSVGSVEGEHTRASELLHTGFTPVPSFPRPSLGALLTHENSDPGFPRNVTLGNASYGPAFLGPSHAPFVIENLSTVTQQFQTLGRRGKALDLLATFNSRHASHVQDFATEQRSAAINSVKKLLKSPFPEALDLTAASTIQRDRYGHDPFGQRVLAAFRLLKMGVPFVEAQLSGWDTHTDNLRRTTRLCHQLDSPLVALMDDLQTNGMWDDTLVVWMGEFGRTPLFNGAAGRDHFPELIPVVLAGGNLGGRLVGRTSEDGSQRVGQKNSVADLMATLLTLLGRDPNANLTTDFGSPTTSTDDGSMIEGIV